MFSHLAKNDPDLTPGQDPDLFPLRMMIADRDHHTVHSRMMVADRDHHILRFALRDGRGP